MSIKTILITGCSTGIGRTTAKYFQGKGWNVVATVRSNPEADTELNALNNTLVTNLDVTKEDTIQSAIAKTIEQFGKIDVLLNNAGYGSYGILEATPEQAIRMQFDVNVIGTLLVTKNVLPYMRKEKDGLIINISSMGGKISFPMGTLYHGSKFAVEGMSEALSFELEAIGVGVKLIEPGMINTNFAETVGAGFNVDPSQTEYTAFAGKVMKGLETANSYHSEPILVAKKIYEAATDGKKQLRYIAGADAEQIITARKQLNDDDYIALIKQNMGL
ncbi:SDR family oxidoreductase [Aliikangiella coralliicola]|uniref:SDR family oxidoreductase n=1 Tax=Aliikangiella coralliicola TaxID=2592383 RepID=A0A545UC09_9GAMM|nr:SDR family oxidoreductase [Aliikangiella coralliicola]TQV87000.1 SDR family oxidoreductase [Aliikangiella coralliicola]